MRVWLLNLVVGGIVVVTGGVRGAAGAVSASDRFFEEQVWAKVGEKSCVECHREGGDADGSEFVLVDPEHAGASGREAALREDRKQFALMAKTKEKDQSRLLLKATGQMKHGGKVVLKPDSAGYKVLAEFVTRLYAPVVTEAGNVGEEKPFFDGVVMLDDVQAAAAGDAVAGGPAADRRGAGRRCGRGDGGAAGGARRGDEGGGLLRPAARGVQRHLSDRRLRRRPRDALSYEHFSRRGLDREIRPEATSPTQGCAQQARYKLAADYRKALLGEPMKLIEYIVRNDRPFTEIVTADYIMVTPYTARGYGIFDELKAKFKNPDDPFEYIPVKLKALVGRHIATTIRNRPRASIRTPACSALFSICGAIRRRRPTATACARGCITSTFWGSMCWNWPPACRTPPPSRRSIEIPTMQASECVVCHKTIDPVAGLFQDYWKFEGVYGRRKEGWFKDMFAPGLRGRRPAGERALAGAAMARRADRERSALRRRRWSSMCITSSPAARCCCRPRIWTIRSLPPGGAPIRSSGSRSRRSRRSFAQAGFNLKNVFKDWIASRLLSRRRAGVGGGRSRTAGRSWTTSAWCGCSRPSRSSGKWRPSSASRGASWTSRLAMLYGGIDSKEVTERAADPSGAMGAIQRILANDVACQQTALDFSRPPAERLLFPGRSSRTWCPAVARGGREDSPDDRASASSASWAATTRRIRRRSSARSTFRRHRRRRRGAQEGFDKQENYHCRQDLLAPVPDPKYTVRAWRAVVTYLLRRPEFLYE